MRLSLPNLTFVLPPKNYRHTNLNASWKEYNELVDTLIYLHEKVAEVKVPMKEYELSGDNLMTKFYFHSHSFHRLMSGFEISSSFYKKEINGLKVIDISSSLIILRAQFETYLMYHHIYVNPKNEDEKELRWYAWMYSSLLNRQSFPSETFYAKGQKNRDQDILGRLKAVIPMLPGYAKLTPKMQKALLNSGSGKLFNHWDKIMAETGYGKNHFLTYFYNFLCTHAHSEGTSILQVKDSHHVFHENNEVAITYVSASATIISSLIITIKKRYKIVEIVYNTLPQQRQECIEYYDLLAKNTYH